MQAQYDKSARQLISEATAYILANAQDQLSFYAWLLMNCKYVDQGVERVGVSINTNDFDILFHYNESWVQSITKQELVSALLHESIHIAHKHMTRGAEVRAHPRLGNIAMDIVTNKILEENILTNLKQTIPDYYIYSPKLPLSTWTFENVYKYLLDNPNIDVVKNKNLNIHDDHSRWGGQGNINDELQKEINDQIINKFLENAGDQAGYMPGDVKKLIKPPKESKTLWQQHLTAIFASASNSKMTYSWMRPHRFRPPIINNNTQIYLSPGVTYQPDLIIGIVVDTSASVQTKLTEKFFGEIESIAAINEVWIAEVDTEIKRSYLYEYGDHKQIQYVLGGGGTDMNPGLEFFINEKPVDIIIVLTDGGLFRRPIKVETPTIWCIPPNGSTRYLKDETIVVIDNE